MMVAAHNADLGRGGALGFRTAFVARPSEHGPRQTTDRRAPSIRSTWSRPTFAISPTAWAADPPGRQRMTAGEESTPMNDEAAGGAQDWRERRRQLQDAVERHMIRYIGDFPPFFIERAEGSYFFDDSGRRILDFTSGQMCATLGHNHPDVVAAIQRSCERAIHLFSWVLAPEVVELCRELAALLPPQLQKVILLNTGSEANEAAIRMAKLASGGHEVVGLTRVVPRPDRRRRRRDLLGRAARLRPGAARQHGDPRAERLSLPDPALRRRMRSVVPRGRLRADRRPARRPARGRDRRADPQHRRRDRAAARLFPAPEGAVRGARHAPDPGRGADRVRPGRRQLRVRAGRRRAGFPRRVQDAGRRHPARRRGDQRRDRGDLLRARLRARHLARLRPVAGGGRVSRCSRCCAASAWPSARSRWARGSRPACAICTSATR